MLTPQSVASYLQWEGQNPCRMATLHAPGYTAWIYPLARSMVEVSVLSCRVVLVLSSWTIWVVIGMDDCV